jgi:hypothetical protein
MRYPQADDPTIERTWAIMQRRHKGYDNRIDRERLTLAVYGRVSKSYDRKIRDALAELPVVWDDGYFIPTSRAEAEGYIAGMRSRQKAISERIRIIEDHLKRTNEPISGHQPILINF